VMIISLLEDLLQLMKNKKQNSDDSENARHWAIAYTELEKVVAYIKTYLVEENES
jgi:negative regulator of genetic competence, sporulation and motility